MTKRVADRILMRCASLAAALLVAGCAGLGGTNPRDPLEGYNRAIFTFNDQLDTYVVKPIAEAYRFVLPGMLRTGVRNFFGNLEDVWIGANNLFQGKIEEGLSDFMRVGINSIVGLGGLLDVASEAGLEKNDEDFGQTLGRWGVRSGPYFVLPFLGPSTVRDSLAKPVDFSASLIGPVSNAATATESAATALSYSLWGVNFAGRRADLLDASKLLDQAALDRYAFVRDAFLQRRRSLVYDGKPPPEKDYEDDEPVKPVAKPPSAPPGTYGQACCLVAIESPEVVSGALTLIEPIESDPAPIEDRIQAEAVDR